MSGFAVHDAHLPVSHRNMSHDNPENGILIGEPIRSRHS